MRLIITLILIAISPVLLAKDGLFVSSTVGWHIPTIINIPLQVGFSGKDQNIGVEYSRRNFNIEDGDVKIKKGDITNYGIFYRKHIYKSWNIYNAINRRSMSADIHVNITNPSSELVRNGYSYTISEVNYEIYTYSLGFGNRWNLKQGVIIGIDYFIRSWILHSENTSNIYVDNYTPIYGPESESIERDLDNFASTVDYILSSSAYLMITFGYTF